MTGILPTVRKGPARGRIVAARRLLDRSRRPRSRPPVNPEESAMTQKTLQDLFIHELSDIYLSLIHI